MNDLTTYENQLPTTFEDLQKFILIGKESLNAQKAKIRAIEKANMALAAKEAALQDTQDIADILLDAEVKLGEMLEKIEAKPIIESSPDGTINKAPLRGRAASLPPASQKSSPTKRRN